MILKVFSPKDSAKKLAFSTQNKAKLSKILIITLVFEKNANFFAENRQKSQKIVIITSTPGLLFGIIFKCCFAFATLSNERFLNKKVGRIYLFLMWPQFTRSTVWANFFVS
jgi:hypothetical protein